MSPAPSPEPALKGRFPFRLGATSYVIPADIVPNVRALAERVDDVEIVLFESDAISPLPGPEIIEELAVIASEHHLTYTVHLPLDIHLGHPDETERRLSVEKCLRAAGGMSALRPFAWVLHFTKPAALLDGSMGTGAWQDRLERSAYELIEGGLGAKRLCIETLDYPFELVQEVVDRKGLSVCLDIGHLLTAGLDVYGYVERFLPRSRVVHLHGVEGGKDHSSLACLEGRLLERIIRALCVDRILDRVVTIEVFDKAALDESLRLLERFTR